MTKIKTKCQHCCRGRSQQTGEKQSITGPYLAEPWEGNNEEKWLMPLFKMRLILWEEPGWELKHEAGRGEAETTQGRFIHNNTVIQNMFHTFHRTAAGSRAEWCHSCTVSHLMLTCQSVCLWIRLLYMSNTVFKYYCEVTLLTAQCAELFTWCSAESDASPLNHISEMMISVQQLRWREADFILFVHLTNSGCDNDAVWRQYKCTTRTRVFQL